ncbi:hypothetical protein KAR91_09600 [Candidatus Pacearchaeota archaeon]|nr:hypothetical protein [Candidatus Pacearchaeota archaeon]
MADHLIEQIMDAVETVLKADPVAAVVPANVFRDRVHALFEGEFPCLAIQDADESPPELIGTALSAAAGRMTHRTILIDVAAYVRGTTSPGPTLNLIQKEVEKAMSADNTLGGLTTDLRYAGRQRTTDGKGQDTIGGNVMNFVATFYCGEKTPDVSG